MSNYVLLVLCKLKKYDQVMIKFWSEKNGKQKGGRQS